MKELPTAGLVVIKNRQLLLAYSKNRQAWYLPGGKIDKGETAVQSLIREIKEELSLVIKEQELTFFRHITAPAYGEADYIIMEQDCFLYELTQDIEPRNEIAAVRFFDEPSYRKEPAQVPGVLLLFGHLKADGLIMQDC
ncbi:DNA mismatch repair protein MutT [Niabella ginsenosidivorans]|uniref:DNA mismatch repair protein MutT n=1 Tax=Niabella ginsenosidivorans TaxID=1176587 RepID=A0A1A9IAE3_9BACT|nr:DNA mismatch repair protein MutT [Niabella ginsenosidivorans]